MNSKLEKTENANEVKLEITVDAEKFENAIKKVYFQNAKYFNIPGFRKGKAPQNIVEKYYGKEIFYEDAFNQIAQGEYEEALKENKIDAVSKPEIDIVTMEKGKDLIFTAVVSTKPEVHLKKYKGIEIEKIEYNVKDEDIQKEINKMQEQNARLITIEDREAKKGDIATIDFEGFTDGKAFDHGKAENYDLTLGSNSFINGFEDQVVGMKINEQKDINVTFPKEYMSKDLAGKDATFKVKLNGLKMKELPKIDDEFAKDVSEFDTLDELKKSIKERIEKQNKDKEKYEKQEAVVKELIKEIDVDIPKGMIELEAENMLKDFEQRISYQGMKFEQYLKLMNKTEEELKKDYEPQAIDAIKSRLSLEAVIKEEKIDATDEEINQKIEEMAKNYGKKADEIKENENIRNYIIEGIKNEKAIDFLISNAQEKEIKKDNNKEENDKKINKKNTKKNA